MVDSFSLINDGSNKTNTNLTIVKHKMSIDSSESSKAVEIVSETSKIEEAKASSSPLLTSLLLAGKKTNAVAATTNGQNYDASKQSNLANLSNTIMGARGATTIESNTQQESSEIIVVPTTSPAKFHPSPQSLLQNHEEALMTQQQHQIAVNLRSPEKQQIIINLNNNVNEATSNLTTQHTATPDATETETKITTTSYSSKTSSDNNLVKDNLLINNNSLSSSNNNKLLNYDALSCSNKFDLSAQQKPSNCNNNKSADSTIPSTSSSAESSSKSILENCLLQPATIKSTLLRTQNSSSTESQSNSQNNKMDESTLTQNSELSENRKVEPLKINLNRQPIRTVIKVPPSSNINSVDSPPKITIKPIKPPENEIIPKITIRPTLAPATVSPTSSSSSLSSSSSMENLAEPISNPASPQKTIQVVPKLHIKNLSESSGNCEVSEPYCVPKVSLRSVPTMVATMPNQKHSSVIVNSLSSDSNDSGTSETIPKLTLRIDSNHLGGMSGSSSGNGTNNHHHHHFNSTNNDSLTASITPKVLSKNSQSILSKDGVKLTIKSIPEHPPPQIPKLTIKQDSENVFITTSTTSSDDPSSIPKLMIKSTAKSISSSSSAEQVPSPIPKLTIKPIVRHIEDEDSTGVGTTTIDTTVPKLNIKPIPPKPDDLSEQHQEVIPKITLKSITNNSNSDNSSFEKVVPKLVVKLSKDQSSYDGGVETGTDCSSSRSPSPSPPITVPKLSIKLNPPASSEPIVISTTEKDKVKEKLKEKNKVKEKEPVPKILIKIPEPPSSDSQQSSDNNNSNHSKDSSKLSAQDTSPDVPAKIIKIPKKSFIASLAASEQNPPNDLHKQPLEINTSTTISNKTADSGQDSPRIILKINKTSKETITTEIISSAPPEKSTTINSISSNSIVSSSSNSNTSPLTSSTVIKTTILMGEQPAVTTPDAKMSPTKPIISVKPASVLMPAAPACSSSPSLPHASLEIDSTCPVLSNALKTSSNDKSKLTDANHAQISSINNSNLVNNFKNSHHTGTKRAHTRSSALEMQDEEIEHVPTKMKKLTENIVDDSDVIIINDDSSNSMDMELAIPQTRLEAVKSVIVEPPIIKDSPPSKLEENRKNLSRTLTRIQKQRKDDEKKDEISLANCEKIQNILLINDGEGSSNDCIMIQEDPLMIENEKNEISQDSQDGVKKPANRQTRRSKRVVNFPTNIIATKQPAVIISPLKIEDENTNDADTIPSENDEKDLENEMDDDESQDLDDDSQDLEEDEGEETEEIEVEVKQRGRKKKEKDDEKTPKIKKDKSKSAAENNRVSAIKGRNKGGRPRLKRTIEVVKDGKTVQITLDGHDDDDSPTFSIWNRSMRGGTKKRGRGGRGGVSTRGKRSTVSTPNRSRENSIIFTTPHLNDSNRKRGFQSSAPSLFEDDTLMSTGDCFQTPASRMLDFNNEDSQSSLLSSAGNTVEGSSRKRGKMEVVDSEGRTEFTVDRLAEYEWPQSNNNEIKSRDTYMIQEQIAEYLGVKSFKRKYPDLYRRPVDMEERNYIYENGLASEKMCDLGVTAVLASEILDIMVTDYPDKFEEYKRYQREKHFSMRNRMRTEPVDKSQIPKNKAIQSASNWNSQFNKDRRENRRCCVDLQNLVIQRPLSATVEATARPKSTPEQYPVALVPGQYAENYVKYTPEQLACYPINTVLVDYDKLENYLSTHPNPYESSSESEDDSSDDEASSTSGGESVSSGSSSDSDVSGSESEAEDPLCKVCSQTQYSNRYKKPERLIRCSSCKNQAHPSCIQMSHNMFKRCLEYKWKCAGCKTCLKCKQKRDNRMLFCDQCDRGYHIYCLGLRNIPEGRWHCEVCTICSVCGVKSPEGHPNPSLTPQQKQELLTIASWTHEYSVNKLTNIREHLSTMCVPCAKQRKENSLT